MNGLGKTAQRLIQTCVQSTTITGAVVSRAQAPVKRDFTRGIWHMSCSKRLDGLTASSTLLHSHSNTCGCGCGLKAMHTKGERELVEFLTEEIVAERKAQKVKVLPLELEGFVICGDGAEVVLSKKLKDELIKITFNVNHTVDSDELEGEVQPEKQEFAEMRSRPQFEVDIVRGDTTLGFTCSYLQEPPAANASADEYSSKIILRSINGDFRSGQLTAILGPSGAGKSTLLNILAGYRVTGASGVISTNGEQRDLHQFRKLSRYIMQEDLLQPYITVVEAMLIAADLKLGIDMSKEKKAVIVEEIIQLLRLQKARNTATERLSGGERKRISIALELLNNPPVIFLDEPTTGLDDVASSTCVSLLKRVARGGRTVVCSLHTPSARLFAEFDHVYVVAGGRCAYQGTAAGVVPFLNELQLPCPKTYNPADFIIEVSSGEYGSHVDRMVSAVENGKNQRWRTYAIEDVQAGEPIEEMEIEQLNAGGVEKHNYKHGCTACQQFVILLKRMLLQTVRNKSYLWLRVGLHLFIGFIVASLFNRMGYDASKTIFNFGFCYACTIAMLYIPMMPVLLAFPTEVQLVKREYFNRWYGLKPYYAALVVSRTPATIFFSLIYLVITYPITSQPMELDRIVMFSVTCILIALISESMGTVISSMLSVVNSVFMGPSMSVPLMLLAVYGIGSGDDPLPIVWRLARACSFLRYGIEGLVAAIYGPPREDLICPDHVDYCEYKNVAYFVKLMGMSGVSFWVDFGALVFILLAMNLTGYYLLRQRLSPNYAFRAIKVIGNFIKTKMSSYS